MILHFAFGSNMSHAVMRKHAPDATPFGIATLADFRFVIAGQGHASLTPSRGSAVYGVLWRITPRDCSRLAAWENIGGGLYRAVTMPVRHRGRRHQALAYIAASGREVAPLGGYMPVVIGAALEWQLPHAYIDELERWSSGRPRRLKEFRWT